MEHESSLGNDVLKVNSVEQGRATVLPAPATRSPLPETDRPILAAAIPMHCDTLLTGDRAHFGKLWGRTIGGVAIHSPRSLAETALKREAED